MHRDRFFAAAVGVFCVVLATTFVSCKKDNPVAPAGINFHITYPKTGDAFSWGNRVTIRWTLPADNSIETVFVYTKKPNQPEEIQNQYFPTVAPVDTFDWYVPSDTSTHVVTVGIQNKLDSTQRDEVSVHINY